MTEQEPQQEPQKQEPQKQEPQKQEPRYARLSFAHHSDRVQREFKEVIIERNVKPFKDLLNDKKKWAKGECDTNLIRAAWLALPAQIEEDEKGFVITGERFGATSKKTDEKTEKYFAPLGNILERVQTNTETVEEVFKAAMQQQRIVYVVADKLLPKPRKRVAFDEILREVNNVAAKDNKWKNEKLTKEGIKNVVKQLLKACLDHGLETTNISESEIVKTLKKAYLNLPWNIDFIGEVATDSYRDLAPEKEEWAKYKAGKEPLGTDEYPQYPRDGVIHFDAIAFIAPREWVEKTDTKIIKANGSIANFFFPEESELKDCRLKKFEFKADIALPARAALERVQKEVSDENNGSVALLTLLPLKIKEHRAFLSMIVAYPSQLVESGLIKDSEAANQLKTVLRDICKEVSRNVTIVEATEALREAFRCRKESFDKVLSKFEVDELELASKKVELEPTNFEGKDEQYLARLDKCREEAGKASICHPLDAFCTDILSTMRRMVMDAAGEDVAEPLSKFSSQERLLLGEDGHREHYLHTFKVFLLGRKFLQSIANYDSDDFIRKRWILASFFHDVCYPIQKFHDWLDGYLKALSPNGVIADVSTMGFLDSWKNEGYEACIFDLLLQLVDYRLSKWLPSSNGGGNKFPRRFQASVLYNLLKNQNHAVLGAVALLHHTLKNENEILENGVTVETLLHENDNYKTSDTKISIVYDAATAILLHDPNVWRALASGRRFQPCGLKHEGEKEIAKLVWTLAYADMVQEWGRDIDFFSSASRWKTPSKINIESNSKEIDVTLTYRQDFKEHLISAVKEGWASLSEVGKEVFKIHDPLPKELRKKLNKNNENWPFTKDRETKIKDKEFNPLLYDPLLYDDAFIGFVPKEIKGLQREFSKKDKGSRKIKPGFVHMLQHICHKKNEGFSYMKMLSLAAALHDLLDDKIAVKTKTWRRAWWVLSALDKNKRSLETWLKNFEYTFKGKKFRVSPDELIAFGKSVREEVRRKSKEPNKTKGAVNDVKKTLEELRRFRGFWRIPWQTRAFWGMPRGELKLCIKREIHTEKGLKKIDVIPPELEVQKKL